MTTIWPYVRMAAAVLGFAAIVRQLMLAVNNAVAAETVWGGHVGTVVANFFSYFTILSNALAVVALVIGAVWGLRTRGRVSAEPTWLATLFLCVSTYMIVTGIVYNLLLRSISIAGISDVWTNETLHVVIPVFMLADVLFAPGRRALPWGAMLTAVVFPIVWVVYTLVRANFITGPATGNPWWYPYPFLDPHLVPGSYVGVSGYIIGIAAAIIVVAASVVWVGRRRASQRENADESPLSADKTDTFG